MFVAFMAAIGAVFVVGYQKDTKLLDDIIYTKDSYGNNCGKPGSVTAALPKAIFPTLDADILANLPILMARP